MTSSNLSKNINVSIEDKFLMFIDSVTKKYTIDKDELIKLWNSDTETSSLPTVESLKKLTVPKLKNLCDQNGIKYKKQIKKDEIIQLILNPPKPVVENKPKKSPTSSIIKNIISKKSDMVLSKNQFNNFEHTDTGFVFDPKTKKVFGKQNVDGTIKHLTEDDIELCYKYKFQYEIPENLNKDDDFRIEEDDDIDKEIDDVVTTEDKLLSDDEFEIEDYEDEDEE